MNDMFSPAVLQLLRTVQGAGFACVIVGGAVRDALRGVRPGDYDLACSASTAQLLALLPDASATGGEYGTVTVERGGVRCEITPFRAEGDYTDGRHPGAVRFGVSLEEDLARRDLTVNAMAWDGSTLTDPFGGQEDLRARRIRTVGDPVRRFTEDGLRILRALRFASVLDFETEPEVLRAAIQCRSQLRAISLPRLRTELQGAVLGSAPQALDAFLAAGGLRWLGLRTPQAPSCAETAPEAAAEPAAADAAFTLAPLAHVPCRMLLRWWAFLTLLGADKKYFCAKMGFADHFYRDLVLLDACFAAPADRITLKRRAAKKPPVSMEEMLDAFCALDARFEENRAVWAEIAAADEPCTMEQLAITGRELLALGLRGPAIGKRMDLLLEAVLAEPNLNSKNTLIALSMALDGLDE